MLFTLSKSKAAGNCFACILLEETFEKLEEVLKKHKGVFIFREGEFSRL